MKRIISMLLALCLVIGLCPAYAGAAEDELGQVRVIVENTTFLEPVTSFDGTVEPAWTGTLLDIWVELTADSTVGSCVASAVTGKGYTVTGAETGYISGINGLEEFAGGAQSGWMVTVNDWFINQSVTEFSVANKTLEAGDEIRMMYTCTGLGADLGSSFSSTDTRLKALAFSAGTLDATFDPDTHGYTLTVPAGTTELKVTPTAMNKNFQVHTYMGDTEYKRTAAIPVKDGTEITVRCGDPDWPSMSTSSGPSIYSIRVEVAEKPLYTKPTYTSFSISGDKISKDCGTDLPYSLYRDSEGNDEIIATEEAFNNLEFIPDNEASVGAVELYIQRDSDSESGWLWGIDFVGFGSGRLVYTDTDGTVYSVAIESVLPERGFSTQPTLTEASYMKTGDSYTIGQPFYYVYPEGITIKSAEFTQSFNNADVPSCVESEQYSNNVWQFTITKDLETYPQFYLHVTFHTDWEKEMPSYGTSGWIMLYSGVEHLGYRLVWKDGSNYFWDPSSELLNSGIVGLTNGVIFYRDQGSGKDELLVTAVDFVPDDGTAADAVVPTNYKDYIWKLKFQSPGSGTLRCTDENEKVWDIPISIELDSTYFFSPRLYSGDALLQEGTTFPFGGDTNNTVWLMNKDGYTAEQADSIEWSVSGATGDVDDYITWEKVPREGSTDRYDVKVTIHASGSDGMTIRARVTYDYDGGSYSESARLLVSANSDLTQLGTPTELAWGRVYSYSTEYTEHPGALSAKVVTPTQNQYQWEVYRVVEDGDDELVDVQSWDYGSEDTLTYIDDACGFAKGYSYNAKDHTDDWCIPSGTYYFTVYAEGDDVTYRDSAVAVSDTWTYVKPETHLTAPTDLYWDAEERVAHWTDSNTEVEPYKFEIAWFLQKEDGTWREVGGSWGFFSDQDKLKDYVLERNGAGSYAFRVRALSPDITEICNSVWSELSPVLDVGKTTEQVVASLGSVKTDYDSNDNGTLTSAEDRDSLRREVADIGINSLSTAMAADTGDSNGNGTVNQIAALEKLVGGAAEVAVSDDMKDAIDATKVSIVGANLNTTGDATATLNIAPAKEAEVIDTQYQNTITFSMELENVEKDAATGHQQLTVPVQITIPVPSTIDPAFLVILHHTQNGTEEVIPRIYTNTEDNTTYAVFVITSFSDFTIAEQRYSFDDDGGMTVNAGGGVSQVLAAVYGGNGQMVACVSAEVKDGRAVLTFPEDITIDEANTGGAKLKVFYLNADHSPARETLEIPLS